VIGRPHNDKRQRKLLGLLLAVSRGQDPPR